MEFNFNLVDKDTPDVVIKNALQEIEVATKGYVKGHIDSYDGPIRSYTRKRGLSAIQVSLSDVNVDIQEDLGVLGDKRNRYEVFLSVKGLEQYKYRMLFVDYGTISYPVTVVLNEKLALEYMGKVNDTYEIATMNELAGMMEAIINSDTMVALLQSLINEALRQENKVINVGEILQVEGE